MSLRDPHRHVVLRGVSPARLRILVAIVISALMLIGWGLFTIGRSGIGLGDTGPSSDLASLRQSIRERDTTIQQLRRSVAELDTLKASQEKEREEVSRTIGELQAEVARQRQQLDFYKGIVSSTERPADVAIRSLRIDPSTTAGRVQLRLSLVQPGNPQGMVSGRIKVTLEGAKGSRPVRVPMFEMSYNFRYFENIERELTIPDGVSPERLQVEIEPSGRPGRPVVQSLLWPL